MKAVALLAVASIIILLMASRAYSGQNCDLDQNFFLAGRLLQEAELSHRQPAERLKDLNVILNKVAPILQTIADNPKIACSESGDGSSVALSFEQEILLAWMSAIEADRSRIISDRNDKCSTTFVARAKHSVIVGWKLLSEATTSSTPSPHDTRKIAYLAHVGDLLSIQGAKSRVILPKMSERDRIRMEEAFYRNHADRIADPRCIPTS